MLLSLRPIKWFGLIRFNCHCVTFTCWYSQLIINLLIGFASSWKSSSPPPCLCMCKWKWGKRHAWIKSSVDNKTKGNEGCKQWLHICKLRFMMFNFGARWDQAFFAKGRKLSYNPVYVITDHSALTTRSQVYSACLLCHFENTLSFNAEKIVLIFSSRLIQIILFSHLAIAHIYCLVKIIVRSTSYITQQVKWVNKRSWT